MHQIEHLLHINAPLNKVYEAIKDVENIKQWYTTDVVDNLDNTKTFKWGEMFLITKCNEIENEKITWEFLESSMPIESLFMTYELSENEGKTRIRFTYGNFSEKSDFYANQNFSSAKYLESLRQFCQTGNGEAFGSGSYRS
ncbi:MAG: SRPBCC domain-containing protein [Parvicellaceae bacterium]|tara:strand:+ start:91 stop:513 length:423 start_codon:yes stop_codon:yes gene_type:complete